MEDQQMEQYFQFDVIQLKFLSNYSHELNINPMQFYLNGFLFEDLLHDREEFSHNFP